MQPVERKPTKAQQRVLEEKAARVRVVQASPGSGKTWLIAEAIRQELTRWDSRFGGIAALSFTNVAGEEIRAALGRVPGHPHFIGTIDAFLYRFVVRPFASWALEGLVKQPVLIAAERVPYLDDAHWGQELMIPTGDGNLRRNLFDFAFDARDLDGNPTFTYPGMNGRHAASHRLAATILQRKWALWKRTGRVSHSDVVFLACEILGSRHGAEVCGLLAGRFPFIVVDELQDTGRYHSMAIRRLLDGTETRGLAVGDPDQSIYEFNGANPDVFRHFERLSGAVPLRLDETLRCSRAVCTAADQLSTSGLRIKPGPNVSQGRALLLVHDGDVQDVVELATELRARVPPSAGEVALLVRKNAELAQLGAGGVIAPKFKSPSIKALHDAAFAYRSGHMRAALASAEAALSRVLFRTPVPTDEDLAAAGISSLEWKYAIGEALLAAVEPSAEPNAYEWGCRMRDAINSILAKRDWLARVADPQPPRSPAKALHSCPPPAIPSSGCHARGAALQIKTVHAAKGETHHTTVYYIPRSKREDRCPSHAWWATEDELTEERRVAFVAATRPRHNFILCVHRETFGRLRASQPAFVAAFEMAELAPGAADRLFPELACTSTPTARRGAGTSGCEEG